jgi:hypothetical protein
MLKAGAMIYAIVFTLLVGIFALALLWIISGNRLIEVQTNNKEKVLLNIFSAAEFALNSSLEFNQEEELVLINQDSCFLKKTSWGLYHIYLVRAVKNKYELKRAFLTLDGRTQAEIEKDEPTVYIIDNDQELKITGETKLKGNFYIPKRGFGRAYIEGATFSGDQLYEGEKFTAAKKLPQLHDYLKEFDIDDWLNEREANLLERLPDDSSFLFSEKTGLYESINPIFIEEQRLYGNLIIHSYDSIYVSANSELENVILISPIVHFETGFEGSIQVFADERIILDNFVKLMYPTVLWLKDRDEAYHRTREAVVEIGEESAVAGTIVMTSKSPDFRIPEKLSMLKGSYFAGNIYNQGETELKGTILGSIYTKNFHLETKNATYTNHLVDAVIDGTALPKYFVLPYFFESPQSNDRLIKWLE